jgi:hypothetical protein
MTFATEVLRVQSNTLELQAQVEVLPFMQAAPEFRSEFPGAYDGYLASFLSSVESFIAQRPGAADFGGVADNSVRGPVISLTIYFSVEQKSTVAAALSARNALPVPDDDDFDQEASWAAETALEEAVTEHLEAEARAAGKMFHFIYEDADYKQR